jgi:hypothetical protein
VTFEGVDAEIRAHVKRIYENLILFGIPTLEEFTFRPASIPEPLAPSSFSNRHERRKHAKVARRNSIRAVRSR